MATEEKDLQTVPGIGPKLEAMLMEVGYNKISDLKGADPERMYHRLCIKRGPRAHVDRCVLYIFRCAVYYASTKRPSREKLKWWNWKDF